MNFRTRALLVFLGVVALFLVYAFATEKYVDQEVAIAKAFCEALVPELDEHRAKNGRYPDVIDASWYRGSPPSLVRVEDFYLPAPDGQTFLLRLKDPRIDPRYWFDDVHGWESRKRVWEQYDGY